MLAQDASRLNLDITFLDVGEHGPAKQAYARTKPGHIDGSFTNPEKIRELAKQVDVITVEIEHVDVAVLEGIESTTRVQIHPSPKTIRIIQDKYIQKEHLRRHSLPVADYLPVDSSSRGVAQAAQALGLPLMLKSRTLAYDGRGNFALRSLEQTSKALQALGDRPLYAEKWATFKKEIAVMVVRSTTGEVKSYPVVETVHKENICHLVYAPLRESAPEVVTSARRIAEKAIESFTGGGVFGVEMFLMEDGTSYSAFG